MAELLFESGRAFVQSGAVMLKVSLGTISILLALAGCTSQSSAPPQPAADTDTEAPSVPPGLAGTAVSPTRIDLSWSPSADNVGVTGYYVYLNDVALATTTATSFSHTGLADGTTYNYRVSAFDAERNDSAWTATPVAVRTPDVTAPSVPTGLGVTMVASNEIDLSWNPSTD